MSKEALCNAVVRRDGHFGVLCGRPKAAGEDTCEWHRPADKVPPTVAARLAAIERRLAKLEERAEDQDNYGR